MADVLRLELTDEDEDLERLEELTTYLRDELLGLDVGDVTKSRIGESPPGSRGADAAAIGELIVNLASAAGGLSTVISTVIAWLTRGGRTRRQVRLKIGGDALELSVASQADQDRLIEMFLSRHAGDERE